MRRPLASLLLTGLTLLAAGCDQLGIESASAVAARKEADGKAVGSACRYSARALEDCFALNRKVDRASIYAGWREMNDYMRENKIDAVAAQIRTESQVATRQAANAEADAAPTPPKDLPEGKDGKGRKHAS